ncbi:MAG: hypothetical protein MI867_03905, partial [Pseudomonadales bacterium]|nr:hypothetical protein [Pseudomonadales bacterium]
MFGIVNQWCRLIVFVSSLVLCCLSTASTTAMETSAINTVGSDTQILWRPATISKTFPSSVFNQEDELLRLLKSLPDENIPTSTKLVSFSFSQEAAVLYLALQASANASSSDYVLYIDYPLLDEIKVYSKTNSNGPKLLFHTGDSFPPSSKPISHRAFAFPLIIQPGESAEVFFVARSRDTLQIPVNVFPAQAFARHMQKEQYILG